MARFGNRILDGLSESDAHMLRPHLTEVELSLKLAIYEPNQPIEHIYFPTKGVVSVLGMMADGSGVEVATIGNEGFVGLPVFLGSDRTPSRAFVQVPGLGFRMDADVFRQVCRTPSFADRLNRYTQALFTLLAQGAACNRIHSMPERCARWLLFTEDRVGESSFTLTQEFLAQMLGVRRAGVGLVSAEFQKKGLIEYSRGQMTIVDRDGLEQVACECYRIISGEFERLLNRAPRTVRRRQKS